jgi:hypothetical protein
MHMTAKRVGDEYRVYRRGKLIAAFINLGAFQAGANLLSTILDAADDGPEVAIINREAAISADEFMGN